MKKVILMNLFLSGFITAFSQSDTTTIYKGLERKKTYAVGLLTSSSDGRKSKYELNGREIDKATYDKYQSTFKNMETCCPCILESYDESDILVFEAIQCTDCVVGWFKEYYPNGNLRVSGKYKENPTGNWKDIWSRKYCNVEVGEWVYYNETGERLYSEFWNEGIFVKQVPEQPKAEIWDIVLLLNEIKIDSQKISINDIKNIRITPKYKNGKTDLDLRIEFEVSADGHKMVKKEFSLETFKNIGVDEMLIEAEIPKEEKTTTFLLRVFKNDGSYWRNFYLKVIR